MKNEKGITLAVLVITICLLFIFAGAAIYTSVNSYKVIDIQKYKVKMQAIQSAVDEFYEEYQNEYIINEKELTKESISKEDFLERFIAYKNGDISKSNLINGSCTLSINNYFNIISANTGYLAEDNWWTKIAKKYGIIIDNEEVQKKYYYLTKDDVENIFDLEDIDISDGFIINFEERYVFSQTPIEITYVEESVEEPLEKEIYCLYELNEEEKVIDFFVGVLGGQLEVNIIEKNRYYQIISVKINSSDKILIKKLFTYDPNEIDIIGDESNENLEAQNRKNIFDEVTGLGTDEVRLKVKSDFDGFYFSAFDSLNGTYYKPDISVKLHDTPVLENNMIPFIPVKDGEYDINTQGKVYHKSTTKNINDWYDYSRTTT